MDFSKEDARVRHLYKRMEELAGDDDREVRVFEQNQSPVHTTLRDHLSVWEAEGAGKYRIGIIRDGLKLHLAEVPTFYEERNNASFREEQEFAVDAI